MNILFAGTPEFACQSLQALVESGYPPLAVVTQPDRPAGRGKKLTASPVKNYARDNDLPVWQPLTLKDDSVQADIAALKLDVMVVAAYGLILPQAVLDLPRAGCINVHASLLPRWRGASPIQAAILAGDTETGISLMRMEAGLDTGPVYALDAVPIGKHETAGELHDRLATLGGQLLAAKLQQIAAGELMAQAQEDVAATYAGKIRKTDAEISWDEPAMTLQRKIRAYNPSPGAWFSRDGERVKCWMAAVVSGPPPGDAPGTVLSADKDGINVACDDGVLRLLELQRPGRNRVTAGEFAAQQSLTGKRFH
jgi:methionyl-tRNA formyltransferase